METPNKRPKITEESFSGWLVVFDSQKPPGCYELWVGDKKGPSITQQVVIKIARKFLKEHGEEHELTDLRWIMPVLPKNGRVRWFR